MIGICRKVVVSLWCGMVLSACLQPAPSGKALVHDGAEIRMLLNEAIQSGATQVTLPPGTYRMDLQKGEGAHLRIRGAKNLKILADQVLILCDKPLDAPLVQFLNCSNVTLRGISVDCDPPAFTQGIVKEINQAGRWIDVKIDEGYETDPSVFKNFRPVSFFEQDRKTWKKGVAEIDGPRIDVQPDGCWRVVKVPKDRLSGIERGDPVLFPAFGRAGMSCRGSVEMKFFDVTMYQSGSMAFHEHGGGGNTLLSGCRVMRRPGTSRLISTNADGFHCNNMRIGPTVENCSFEGMQDDGINVHGMVFKVFETPEGKRLKVVPYKENTILQGDRLEFVSHTTGSLLGEFTVLAVRQLEDVSPERVKKYHNGFGQGRLYELILDRPAPVDELDLIYNLNACGANFTIRNNHIGTNRYRGILLRGGPGLVENNTIMHTGSSGIIGMTDHLEGPYPRDLLIRNNTLVNNGMLPYSFTGFGIMITTGEQGYAGELDRPKVKNIRIENNTIRGSAKDAIRIENAGDVELIGNTISETGRRQVTDKRPANITLINSTDVTQKKNRIKKNPHADRMVERSGDTFAEWDWRRN